MIADKNLPPFDLANAITAVGLGLWEVYPTTGEVLYHTDYFSPLGYAPDKAPTTLEEWVPLIHPADFERLADIFQKVSHERHYHTPIFAEARLRHNDGRYLWYFVTGRAVAWDAEGRPTRLVGCVLDVSHAKEAELQRAAENDLLRLIVDTIPELVLVTDAAERYVMWNVAAQHFCDLSEAELIGRTPHEIFPAELAAHFKLTNRRVLQSGKAELNYEIELHDARQEAHQMLGSKSPIIDRAGQTLGLLILYRDITERKRLEEQLRYQATHDTLTDLPNRRYLMNALQSAFTTSTPGTLALLFCDIDHFKRINDGWGHSAGDAVLQVVATRLQQVALPECVVARLAGDEFMVLCPNVSDRATISTFMQSILTTLAVPVTTAQGEIPLSISIGGAVLGARHQLPDDLLRDADRALYLAKAAGRNQAVWFSDPAAEPPVISE